MATIAIGDVHGNRPALDDLLTHLEGELEARDTVVFLGDYIDRGTDSKGCIDRILRFRAESRATVIALLGNHEDGLLRTREDPHGHWNNSDLDADGRPLPAVGRASVGIDTISHGVLTAFRLPDRRVFQSQRFR